MTSRLFGAALVVLLSSFAVGCSNESVPSSEQSQPVRVSEAETVTETGTFQTISGVGGETTGYGLQKADGTIVELDLETHDFEDEFRSGRAVRVQGQFTTVSGVETRGRRVLVVTSVESRAEVRESGTFQAVVDARGREVGFGLKKADGTVIELDLEAHDLEEEFERGKAVTLEGTYDETGSRRVFVVTRIER